MNTPQIRLWWYGGAVLVASVLCLFALERQWPALGLWLFVGLTITLGFGHGALDMALMLSQFKPRSKALLYGLIYLALTLTAGWLLSLSFAGALAALLVMSVWHFGEAFGQSPLLRLAVGGSSLMAPALLQQKALSDLLRGVSDQDLSWLLSAWDFTAWAWLGLVGLIIVANAASKFNRAKDAWSAAHFPIRAQLEIGGVLLLSLVFSPLLQFALYFGLFHCVTHIARVRRAMMRHQEVSIKVITWAWIASMLLTMVLLIALWNWLPVSNLWATRIDAQMLHWIVVALGAVTLPHLLLIGYSNRWLGR